MNTEITYLYRDASNYKQLTTVVVVGEITPAQVDEIVACLFEGEYFVPSLVGLPENRFESWTEDDHPWFELCKEDFASTERPATIELTADQLVEKFRAAKERWNDAADDIEVGENFVIAYNALNIFIPSLNAIKSPTVAQKETLEAAVALKRSMEKLNDGASTETLTVERRRKLAAANLLPSVIDFIHEFDYHTEENDTGLGGIAAKATSLYEELSSFLED